MESAKRERKTERLAAPVAEATCVELSEMLNTDICCIPLSHADTMAQEFLRQIPAPIFLNLSIRLVSLVPIAVPFTWSK